MTLLGHLLAAAGNAVVALIARVRVHDTAPPTDDEQAAGVHRRPEQDASCPAAAR